MDSKKQAEIYSRLAFMANALIALPKESMDLLKKYKNKYIQENEPEDLIKTFELLANTVAKCVKKINSNDTNALQNALLYAAAHLESKNNAIHHNAASALRWALRHYKVG